MEILKMANSPHVTPGCFINPHRGRKNYSWLMKNGSVIVNL